VSSCRLSELVFLGLTGKTNVLQDENSCIFIPPSLPTHFWSSPHMFWCLGGVRRANSWRKCCFFWKECTLPFSCVVVVSFCFFRKEEKEVRLSVVFLAGAREDVRVDVRIERGVLKKVYPLFFLCLVRNCQIDVLLF